MDNKNENLAADTRSNPLIRAAVIVMPDREVPGINAIDWKRPIKNASFQFKSFKVFVSRAEEKLHQSKKAKIIVDRAITRLDLK